MALVSCPNCGNEVSDKAKKCVHCNYIFPSPEKNICPECGKEIEEDADTCPNCGYPLVSPDKAEAENADANEHAEAKDHKSKPFKSRKAIALVLTAIIVISALIFGIMQNREETYAANLYDATYVMLDGCAKAETACNLIQKTWNNAIWQKSDKEMNQYVKKNGVFVSDFNDALDRLFKDDEFCAQLNEIAENQSQVNSYMKALQNPPKKQQAGYQKITELYEEYLQFTNMALNPNGSLNSFAEDFAEIDKEVMKRFEAMQVYIQ